ncbi:MAG TPA: zf-HC2 domain-containing protein [Vicinamibacterales bacterium]|nr:zf-HC2 domain-containing protein [Vicinamibacterales bacterium]
MTCAEFRDMAESYQAGELPMDTNHEVLAHLERCADCRRELDARVTLRQTLRQAFEHAPTLAPEPRFVASVRATLEDHGAAGRGFGVSTSWLALAAGVVLVVALGWQYGRIDRPPVASATLSALGVHAAGDHRYCALEHALDEPVITLDEAARRYNPIYASLREVVAQSAAVREGGVDILGAHWCVFKGRQFGHVIARHSGRVVSILVTPTGQASSAGSPAATCEASAGLQVACFDAPGHGVFVVSDLGGGELIEFARSLAPSLQAYFARA